jgi:outer membrane receptor protein involved in Fe transport
MNARASFSLAGLFLLLASAASAQSRATFLHTPVASARAGQAIRVEGSLLGGSRIERVRVKYRGQGTDWKESPLELQYGDLYRGFIPGDEVSAPWLDYYVEGVRLDRSVVTLFTTEAQPVRLVVTGEVRRESAAADPPRPKFRPRAEPAADVPPPLRSGGRKPPPADADPVLANDEPEPGAARPPPRAAEPAQAAPRRGGTSRGRASERVAEVRSELEEELLLYGAEDTVALATRHEESVTRVPAVASSWTRGQIQALGARNVFEFLDFLPGFSVSRDVQGFYRLGVRGLRSDPEVLFLLNGHPMNNVFDGRALAALPVENIERVEVIRGPGSAIFGAGAFLGVVNIITDTTEGLRATFGGGSYETLDGHVQGSARVGGWKISLDAEGWNQSGDRKAISTDNLYRTSVVQGLIKPDEPAGYTHDRRLLVNAGVSATVGEMDVGRVGVALRYLREDRAALVGLFDVVGPDSRLTWDVLLGDVTFDRELGAGATLRLHAWADQQVANRLFQITPRNFRPRDGGPTSDSGLLEQSLFTTRTLGLEGRVELGLGDQNRLSAGASVQHQSLPDYRYLTNYEDTGEPIPEFRQPEDVVYPQDQAGGVATGRLSFALHAQDQWTPWERLSLTVGLRLDAVQLPTTTGEGADIQVTGLTLVPSFNPRAGVVFSATDRLVLKLLYGRAFRAPTLQELTESIPSTSLNQGRFIGNPRLRPPTVDAFEFALDHLQVVGGDARLRLRGNAFFENFVLPIARVDTSGNIVPLANRVGVHTVGLEGEARLEAGARASAFVNASWFRAVDLESPPQSQLLTDTPQARLNAGFSLPLGDWLNLDLSARYSAERRNNSRSMLETVRRYTIPASTLVNAQLRTERLWGHFELSALVQNVFQYQTYDEPPRPDRVPGLIPREGLGAWLMVRGNL